MIRMGVLCPSEIAARRFMPALMLCKDCFSFAGVAVAAKEEWGGREPPSGSLLEQEAEKARRFGETYGGRMYASYSSLIADRDIDAVYVPLPPALHFPWGRKVLESGKHLFMEKPFTTCRGDTESLISLAAAKHLAVHENYMFVYHSQLSYIKQLLAGNSLGTVRLARIDFGFPFRGAQDFRYNKDLGGGALTDCGGYTLRLATELLGGTATLTSASLVQASEYSVDIAGAAIMENAEGVAAQLAFGMDNTYRCSLDIWGSKMSLYTNRILTAPAGYVPEVILKSKDGEKTVRLNADDTFLKSLQDFYQKISAPSAADYSAIIKQAILIDEFKAMSKSRFILR